MPDEHDGTEAFTLTLTFSDEPSGLSYKTVRDSLFTEEGGTIEGARRESPPSNQAFVVTVKPGGNEAVTLTLKPVPPCGQEKTVCTAGRAVLNGRLGVTVPGPAALSVADAQVQEGPGAVLEFVVSLDRRRHAPVRVDYATENGEAVAGDDYVHTAGTLTFAPGETGHTVSVPVLADEHDEDSETLTLKLRNPVGARIADNEAVGTIHNNGAIPKAWIARFGRTVAEQVLVAVEGRMRATPASGVEVTLAGERIGGQAEPGSEEERDARREEEARRDAQRFADWLRGETDPEEAQRRSRSVTPRDLQTGSSFALTSETAGKDLVSLWGRGAVSRFDGREGRLTLDGEVVTGMLGADWTRGRWTAGLIVSHSAGEGGYSGAPGAGDGPGAGTGTAAGSGPGSGSGTGGRVEATLTGVFPWARHALSERLEAWGAAGYGQGELTVTPKKPGTDEDGAAIRTDLDLRMAAAGLRGVLLDPESGSGFQLTGKTDAMVVQTASGRGRSADGGNLAPARATVSRLRLGLEASRPVGLGGGAALMPSLEGRGAPRRRRRRDRFWPRPRRRARAQRPGAWSRGRTARAGAPEPRVEGLARAQLLGRAQLAPEAGVGPGREADADPDGGRHVLRRRRCAARARHAGRAGGERQRRGKPSPEEPPAGVEVRLRLLRLRRPLHLDARGRRRPVGHRARLQPRLAPGAGRVRGRRRLARTLPRGDTARERQRQRGPGAHDRVQAERPVLRCRDGQIAAVAAGTRRRLGMGGPAPPGGLPGGLDGIGRPGRT